MNNFAKTVLVILGIITCFWVKETFLQNKNFGNLINIKEKINSMKPTVFDNELEFNETGKKIVGETEEKADEKKENTAKIYFLQSGKNNETNMYISKREFEDLTIKEVVKSLLKGPSVREEKNGVYSEIPKGTKLLSVIESEDKIIINLNDDFQYGGGSDSVDNRLKQLTRTVMAARPKKDIYLYLNGKQADVIGGDGIMLTQPLNQSDYGY